jgi:hypothetical protein
MLAHCGSSDGLIYPAHGQSQKVADPILQCLSPAQLADPLLLLDRDPGRRAVWATGSPDRPATRVHPRSPPASGAPTPTPVDFETFLHAAACARDIPSSTTRRTTISGPRGVKRAQWCDIPGLLEDVSFDTHSLSAGPDLPTRRSQRPWARHLAGAEAVCRRWEAARNDTTN